MGRCRTVSGFLISTICLAAFFPKPLYNGVFTAEDLDSVPERLLDCWDTVHSALCKHMTFLQRENVHGIECLSWEK